MTRSSALAAALAILLVVAAPAAAAEAAAAAAAPVPAGAKAAAAKTAAPLAAAPAKNSAAAKNAAPAAKNAAAPVAKNAAPAVIDCAAVLAKAGRACSAELRRLDAGARLPSASSACCAAAAPVFGPAFASACACDAKVAAQKERLSAARKAAVGLCPALKAAPAVPACPAGNKAAGAGADRDGARNGAAAPPAAAPLAAEPPAWGTGSVCVPPAATSSSCVNKCTPREAGASPSPDQVAAAQKCASSTKGHCDATGFTQCRAGITVADAEALDRKCFRCCTTRLESNDRNACVRPRRRRGGGGGGGGGCFPGSSLVVVEGKGPLPLSRVRVGDRVLSASPGSGGGASAAAPASFETVYFFAHAIPASSGAPSGELVRLEVDGGLAALELTRKHLVPVLPGPRYVRAQDVPVGARVLVVGGGGHSGPSGAAARPATVTASSVVARADGLYAPLTTGGGHVVISAPALNGAASPSAGVVASVHSDWVLDPLFETFGAVSSLHGAYEAVYGAPLKALYRLAGPGVMRAAGPVLAAVGNGEAAGVAAGLRALVGLQQQAAQKA